MKVYFLTIKNIEEAWTRPMVNCGLILNQYLIIFESRCRLYIGLHNLMDSLKEHLK